MAQDVLGSNRIAGRKKHADRCKDMHVTISDTAHSDFSTARTLSLTGFLIIIKLIIPCIGVSEILMLLVMMANVITTWPHGHKVIIYTHCSMHYAYVFEKVLRHAIRADCPPIEATCAHMINE